MFAAFVSEIGLVGVLYGVAVLGHALIVRVVPRRWRLRAGAVFLHAVAAVLAALPATSVVALALLVAVLLFRGARAGLQLLAVMAAVGLAFSGPVADLVRVAGFGVAFGLVMAWRRQMRPEPPFRIADVLACGVAAGAGATVSAVPGAIGAGDGAAFAIAAAFVTATAAASFYCWLMHLDLERRESAETRILRRLREDASLTDPAAGGITEYVGRMDLDGRILDASDAYLDRMGYTLDEIRSKRLDELRVGARPEDVRAFIDRLRETGAASYEVAHRTRSGDILPLYVTAVYSRTGGYCYAFLRDITERKRAERAIEEKNEALRDALEKTIAALATTLGAHSLASGDQIGRMRAFTERLGAAYGLDAFRLEGLGLVAMVHDIGEIGTPVEILNRPRRLDDDEMELVRLHSEAGHDILKGIRFPWPIAEIVWQHHENFDGSGYPRGLSGTAILPEARIVRVADSVMAMLSHRPFRRAFDREHVIAELQAGAGHQYDPEIVALAVSLLRQEVEQPAAGSGALSGEIRKGAA